MESLVKAIEACTVEELGLLIVMLSAVERALNQSAPAPVNAAPTGEAAPRSLGRIAGCE